MQHSNIDEVHLAPLNAQKHSAVTSVHSRFENTQIEHSSTRFDIFSAEPLKPPLTSSHLQKVYKMRNILSNLRPDRSTAEISLHSQALQHPLPSSIRPRDSHKTQGYIDNFDCTQVLQSKLSEARHVSYGAKPHKQNAAAVTAHEKSLMTSSATVSRSHLGLQELHQSFVEVEFEGPPPPWNEKEVLEPQKTIETMPRKREEQAAAVAVHGRFSKALAAASSQSGRQNAFVGVENAGLPPLPPLSCFFEDEDDRKLPKAIDAIPLEVTAPTGQERRSKASTAASSQPRLGQA
jgi:hypothetical protein